MDDKEQHVSAIRPTEPESPPLLTETIYNVPKRKRRRIVIAICIIVAIVVLGTAALWAVQQM